MRKLLLSILMFGLGYAVQGQEINDWENPQVIGINKEPYHANLTLPSKRYSSGECESLDGVWNSVGLRVQSKGRWISMNQALMCLAGMIL